MLRCCVSEYLIAPPSADVRESRGQRQRLGGPAHPARAAALAPARTAPRHRGEYGIIIWCQAVKQSQPYSDTNHHDMSMC